MKRPVDENLSRELFEKIIQFAARHGLSALSMNALAKAVGSTPRGILQHFDSEEELIHLIFFDVLRRLREILGGIQADTPDQAFRMAWEEMIKPESLTWFRLFFQAYGEALQRPKAFGQFLGAMTEDWLSFWATGFAVYEGTAQKAVEMATLVVAGFRGFLMDYCATQDRARVTRAVEIWISGLSSMMNETPISAYGANQPEEGW
jgi:AcrR family transcriptional regulator